MAEKKNGGIPAGSRTGERIHAVRGVEPRRAAKSGGPERTVEGALRLLVADDDRVYRIAVPRALVQTGTFPHIGEADGATCRGRSR